MTLMKAVLNTIPISLMACINVPKNVIKRLEQFNCWQFFYGVPKGNLEFIGCDGIQYVYRKWKEALGSKALIS